MANYPMPRVFDESVTELALKFNGKSYRLSDDAFTRYSQLIQRHNVPLFSLHRFQPSDYSVDAVELISQSLPEPYPLDSLSSALKFIEDRMSTPSAVESHQWMAAGSATVTLISLLHSRNPLTLVLGVGIGAAVGCHARQTFLWYHNPNFYTEKSSL